MGRSCVAIVMGLALALPASAQQKRVYLAPDDHTDYFWTADDVQYRQAFLFTLDYYLNLADATQNNPPAYQSRWACDGWLWMWEFERNRTPAQFQRLIGRIADGHISVPLNGLANNEGGASLEAIVRGAMYPGRIERRYGIEFPLAYNMENQTHPLGLWSIWAGCGARYSWKGVCGCDTQTPTPNDRQHEIYWAVGKDGSRMLVKWNSLFNWDNQGVGGYAEARFPSAAVDFVTANAPFNGFLARWPYQVIGAFGKGWDDFQTQTSEFIGVAQTMTNASRQVIVSNEVDFFEDFESVHGSGLPSESVSYGNEWDLYAASLQEQCSRVKRSLEKLRSAEAMAAIVSQHDPAFMNGREAGRDLAFANYGLFWEHDFGMVGPQTGPAGVAKRIAWQRRLADEIAAYVDDLHEDARLALGALISPSSVDEHFAVFNPLSWVRSDAVDVRVTTGWPVHVVDVASGQAVPSQVVSPSPNLVLRVWAQDIPSVGYRVYRIAPGEGPSFSQSATSVAGGGGSLILENATYRVTVDPRGSISGLVDKTRGNREFAQSIGGRVLNDLGASAGTVALESVGPVSATLLATAAGPPARSTRVTLYRSGERIEIDNRITQNFGGTYAWAFGFNLSSPDVRHEELGAILRARLASGGGDYATRNARYDWLTLNHFADMTGSGDVGVTLSNSDCSFIRLGSSTTTSLDVTTPQLNVLAGGLVVNGSNGLPNQGGDSQFTQRFAIRTHGTYNQTAAMKFAMEHQNPLTPLPVGPGASLGYQPYSAIQVSDPDILLWALKTAEEGIDRVDGSGGLIARFWNVADASRSGIASGFPSGYSRAWETTHIETNRSDAQIVAGSLSMAFAPQQVRTYRVAPPSCTVDANGDGRTDAADLSVLLGQFGTAVPSGSGADFNGDGQVNGADLSVLLANFGCG